MSKEWLKKLIGNNRLLDAIVYILAVCLIMIAIQHFINNNVWEGIIYLIFCAFLWINVKQRRLIDSYIDEIIPEYQKLNDNTLKVAEEAAAKYEYIINEYRNKIEVLQGNAPPKDNTKYLN